MRPDEIVDRYLEAVTARSLEQLDAVAHPDYRFREWPNAINPSGGERDLASSRAGLELSQTLLAEHSFDVHEHLVHGDTVVSRMTWRGTLAATGQELVAHISQHSTVKDGRILRTESFDCYEPRGDVISRAMEPTQEQIDAYRRDGFLVVEEWLDAAEVERAREHFARCFAHEWETGLMPDEVNYDPKTTPPDRTRQLCNVWKADRALAGIVRSSRIGSFGAALAGVPGLRLIQDNAIWKPPSGKALLCHQDAAYLDFLDPKNMTTCWMALDDTAADTGTIYYVRGSNHWPRAGKGGEFHAPDDWLGHVKDAKPEGEELELVPIEVPAGGAAFHDGWTFHGSPANERADAERRAIISHTVSTVTRWNEDGAPHPIYSKYRRPGERELDDAFFPAL